MKYLYALLFVMFIIFCGYTVNGVMVFADNMKNRVNMINHTDGEEEKEEEGEKEEAGERDVS